MSIPRDAWWEKWQRAEEHRQLLADEIVETFSDERKRVRISPERGTEPGEYLFRVTALQTAPLMRWGLMIGDTAHNLRAALDHLAWRLALIHSRGQRPANAGKIVFPIYDRARKFRESKLRPSFDPFHWTVFEEFQPYNGRSDRPDSWSGDYIPQLALLQALTNRDKHQHLTPILLPPTSFRFPGGLLPSWSFNRFGSFTWTLQPLELGAVAVRVRFRDEWFEPQMNVDADITPSVSLPRYGPVVPALERIGLLVRQILAQLDSLV